MDAASCFFCNFCLSTLAGVMRALGALGKPDWRGSIAQLFCEGARSTGGPLEYGGGEHSTQAAAAGLKRSDF